MFHTPIGRIGMLVCYDVWFPESFRLLALKGADIICCPADWLDRSPAQPATMGVVQAMAAASSNRVFVVAASRTGTERGAQFAGQSLICGVNGRLLAGPMAGSETGPLVAQAEWAQSRRLNSGEMNTIFRDRRTDVYDLMLGSGDTPLPR